MKFFTLLVNRASTLQRKQQLKSKSRKTLSLMFLVVNKSLRADHGNGWDCLFAIVGLEPITGAQER